MDGKFLICSVDALAEELNTFQCIFSSLKNLLNVIQEAKGDSKSELEKLSEVIIKEKEQRTTAMESCKYIILLLQIFKLMMIIVTLFILPNVVKDQFTKTYGMYDNEVTPLLDSIIKHQKPLSESISDMKDWLSDEYRNKMSKCLEITCQLYG